MNNQIKSMFDALANLVRENLTEQGKDTLSHRISETEMYITKNGADFANITENDIEKVAIDCNSSDKEIKLHSEVYSANADCNAICHTHPFYCSTVSEANMNIPPILDDMAQIVGPSARVASSFEYKDVKKALKKRNCCLIKNDGILACTRTLNECVTACLVLEKAGKCFIEGYAIGKPLALPTWEAALMHIVYLKKYSKANQENKLNQEKEG